MSARLIVPCLVLSASLAQAGAVPKPWEIKAEARKVLPDAVVLFRWFHANPELSGHEVETAARMAKELRDIGLEVHEKIGGTGVAGILRSRSNPSGPVVLFRADMDALPVSEATGLPYASTRKGVMHACGHDVHMSNALATLRLLRNIDSTWSGTVLFVAQPAEETGTGARDMLADPKLARLIGRVGKPRLALALHDAADMPSTDVSLVPGYHTANVDSVDITVHGKGGHGSRPHETIDPVLIAADIVVTLQSIVARRIEPGERAVITAGKIEAGTKHNIIPSKAMLLLTVRSYGDEMRSHLLEEIERVAVNVAQAHGAVQPPEIVVRDEFTPSSYNDPTWTERLRRRFAEAIGEEHVHAGEPATGGEDFGRFAIELGIPGVMYRLGAVAPGRSKHPQKDGLPGLHSDGFIADPRRTLETGVTTMSLAILEGLSVE
jgi:hippurate hydrolase